MTRKKTSKMEKVEAEHGVLEDILPDMINELGLTGAANRLGVSKSTLGYWVMWLGLEVKRVVGNRGTS